MNSCLLILFIPSFVLAIQHCCKQKEVNGVTYSLDSSNEDAVNKYGCKNDCVYRKPGSAGRFCFASGEHMPQCLDQSDCPQSFASSIKLEVMQTHESVQKMIDEKIEEYGNLKFPTVKDKLAFIKSDLEKVTGYSWEQITDPILFFENVPETLLQIIEGRKQTLSEIVIEYLTNQDLTQFKNALENINLSVDDSLPKNYFQQRLTQHQVQTAYLSSNLLDKDPSGKTYADRILAAIRKNTNDESTMRDVRVSGDCGEKISYGAAAGAAGGCVTGAIGGAGVGCGPGAFVGLIGGVGGGSVACLADEIGCFATTSIVETSDGFKHLSDVVLGDYVRTSSGGDYTHFTEFLGWMDRHHSAPTAMLEVSTSNGQSPLTLTKTHVVFTSTGTKYADELLPGDALLHWNGTSLEETYIEKISLSTSYGYWAPLTRDGHMLVDGYLTSCYASFPHQLADFAMSPIKAMPKTLLENEESQHDDGVRTAIRIIKTIGNQIGVGKGNRVSSNLYQAAEIQQNFIPSDMMKTEF